jgi:DNA-binding transcriptional LysR family regulator
VDLNQLEVLVAVAEEKGFSRAAERLRRTQPAVSQAVRRLEAEVGTPLVDRSSKDGTLTAAGRALHEAALRMLNLRAEAQATLQELGDLRQGKVTVAANEYTVTHLLPVVAIYRRRHPQVKIEVRRSRASAIPSQVADRAVELGLVTYRPAQPGLRAIQIATDDVALLVAPGHRLAGRGQVSIRELGVESFLAHDVRSPNRERVVQAFERRRTPLHIAVELPTLEAIKRLVEEGHGVALMPRRAAHAEIERGQLVALGVREMRIERHLYLLHRRGAVLSHAAAAFVECARSATRVDSEARRLAGADGGAPRSAPGPRGG